jgi:hypothetical protein
MVVGLQPQERAALFSQISANFTLVGDLELAMHKGDEEARCRLGRKISDGLRLMIDGGLGWKERMAEQAGAP